VRHGAEPDADGEVQVPAVGAGALRDLHGELARRREDQRAGGALRRPPSAGGKVLQDRQSEGRRLAGSGLGDAEHVAN